MPTGVHAKLLLNHNSVSKEEEKSPQAANKLMLDCCNHQTTLGERCICPASAPSKDFVGSWDLIWGKMHGRISEQLLLLVSSVYL